MNDAEVREFLRKQLGPNWPTAPVNLVFGPWMIDGRQATGADAYEEMTGCQHESRKSSHVSGLWQIYHPAAR